MQTTQLLLAIDGTDGAGKTTLATRLADYVGGRYVKPTASGIGWTIYWLAKHKHFSEANSLGIIAIEESINYHSDASVLVYDRHWMSIHAECPDPFFLGWPSPPPTVLCWADIDTTLSRLYERGEKLDNIDHKYHLVQRYWELAQRYNVPILDTSSTSDEEGFERLLQLPPVMEFVNIAKQHRSN